MALFEKNWYTVPWKLVQNKIVRYPGGREIDRFRGIFPGADDGRPEAWVGSDTRTVNAVEKGDPNDGCAEVILPDGSKHYLFEAVETDPQAALGEAPVSYTHLAGWGTIIYFAALSGVDPQLYEAAEIDGARKWKQLLHITLPSITPTIVVMLILSCNNIVNAGFDQIFMLYSCLLYTSRCV